MDAQVAAYNRGIDIQQKQFETTREDYRPFTLAGYRGIEGYGNLLGSNGTGAQDMAIRDLKASPFYTQSLDDANENLLQTASASGGVRGGNTAGAISQLAPDVLAAYYQQALKGYGDLAQFGLGATGSVASAGATNANAQTVLNGQIGTAQAANYLTRGQINANNWNNAGKFLDQAASAFMPTSGIGGALGKIF